jgi:hypothetical protein
MPRPARRPVIVLPRRLNRPVVVRGFPPLLAQVVYAHKQKDRNERHAMANVFMALADFLVANGLHGAVALWLLELTSKLTDPVGGKALPSKTWRRFALVSLGMRALTLDGITREEAARRAVRSVKGMDAKTLLQRYDELQKDGVKNQEARHLFRKHSALLPQVIDKKGAEATARFYFDLANIRA